MLIKSVIAKLDSKKNLNIEESKELIVSVFNGNVPQSELTKILILLNEKGITSDELTGFAYSMRKFSKKVNISEKVVDNCGTGGDGLGTFNISTTSSFIAAACDVRVAKHGNRAVTSNSGSADILVESGAYIELTPEQVSECITKTNFGFMFAPNHHQAMKYVIPSRKEIAPQKTVFNLLGPLTNPANAEKQLIGVYSKEKMRLVAESIKKLGTQRAMIVHSEDGLDEISLFSKTNVLEIKDSEIIEYLIDPDDYDLDKSGNLKEIIVQDAKESLDIMTSVFENISGPARDICILNASALLYLSGKEKSIKDSIDKCKSVLENKMVKEKFNFFIETTKSYKKN